jgi:hypothetical protein
MTKREDLSVTVSKESNGYIVRVNWEEGKGNDVTYKDETWIFTDRDEVLKKFDELLET